MSLLWKVVGLSDLLLWILKIVKDPINAAYSPEFDSQIGSSIYTMEFTKEFSHVIGYKITDRKSKGKGIPCCRLMVVLGFELDIAPEVTDKNEREGTVSLFIMSAYPIASQPRYLF